MSLEDKALEGREGARELELVTHDGGAVPSLESVVVTEAAKRPCDHLVPEPPRTVPPGDPSRQAAPTPEVPRLPGDRLARTQQPARSALDNPLAGIGGGIQVKVDAEREVETTFGRRVDQRLQLDQNE